MIFFIFFNYWKDFIAMVFAFQGLIGSYFDGDLTFMPDFFLLVNLTANM
jgi:hypothetical protein